jgi:aspartate/methionine/tyrosine aminotransferase
LFEHKGGQLIVDEIYHGLSYERDACTRHCNSGDDIFVVQSFSKYFKMTGWRLGWLVVPERFMYATSKSWHKTCSSHHRRRRSTPALAAFAPATLSILETRRQEFQAPAGLPGLRPWRILASTWRPEPEGAFYIYANCERVDPGQ